MNFFLRKLALKNELKKAERLKGAVKNLSNLSKCCEKSIFMILLKN